MPAADIGRRTARCRCWLRLDRRRKSGSAGQAARPRPAMFRRARAKLLSKKTEPQEWSNRRSLLFPREIVFKNEERRPPFFPIVRERRRNYVWSANKRAKNNVGITISIEIADIHGQPATIATFWKRISIEPKLPAVFQVNEAFLGAVFVIREIGDGGNIHVPVFVEIRRHRLIRSVQWEKPGLAERVFSVVQVQPDAMIVFQRRSVFAVVAVGSKDVDESILVEVH